MICEIVVSGYEDFGQAECGFIAHYWMTTRPLNLSDYKHKWYRHTRRTDYVRRAGR